jgi:drug/metabolite transporter (DMT)-like permease
MHASNTLTGPAPTRWQALPSVLALLFNAFVWGVSWWPLRRLEQAGVHPLWATALIYLLALGCTVLSARRAGRAAPAPRPVAAGAGRRADQCVLQLGRDRGRRGARGAAVLPDAGVVHPAGLVAAGRAPARGLAAAHRAGPGRGGGGAQGPGRGLAAARSMADWLALAGGFSFALTNVLLKRLHAAPAEARVLAMFGGGSVLSCATAAFGMAQGSVAALPAPAPTGCCWPRR